MKKAENISLLRKDIMKLAKVHGFHQELNYVHDADEAVSALVATLNDLYETSYIFLLLRNECLDFRIYHSMGQVLLSQYLSIFKSEIEDFLGYYPDLSEKLIVTDTGNPSFIIQSSFTIPIMAENHFYGMLSVGHSKFSYFSEEDIELTSLLASNLAQKLESLRLTEQLRINIDKLSVVNSKLEEKLTQLSALNAIGKKISSSLSVSEIKDMVLTALSDSFPVNGVIDSADALIENQRKQKAIISRTSESGRSFFLTGQADKDDLVACIPLTLTGDQQEFLAMTALEDGFYLSSDDREFVSLLAQQINQALLNAKFYESSKKAALDKELRLSALFNLSELLASMFNRDELLQKIVLTVHRIFAADRCLLLLVKGEDLVVEAVSGTETEDITGSMLPVGQGVTGWVASSRTEVVINNIADQDRVIPDPVEGLVEGPLMAVPLVSGISLNGVIAVKRCASDNTFSEDDVRLLKTLAQTLALVLENSSLYLEHIEKEHLEEELRIAWDIQHSVLPETPPGSLEGRLAATSIPARFVGGDYYDFLDLGNNRYAICIADVSGKGIPSALLMIMVRTFLRVLDLPSMEPSQVLWALNTMLCKEIDPYRFVTMQYLLVDLPGKKAVLSNAGHEPLLLLNKEGKICELRQEGIPIGIDSGFNFTDLEIPLNEGETIIMYTDGIIEATDKNGNFYGKERLEQLIACSGSLPAKDILDSIIADISLHKGDSPQHDDVTLVVFRC